MESKTEFVIQQDGSIMARETKEFPAGNIMSQIRSEALAAGAFVPQVLPKIDMQFLQENKIVVGTRLNELVFRTDFSLDSSGKIIWPTFKQTTGKTLPMTLTWTTPSDMFLFFIGYGDLYPEGQNEWQWFLAAIAKQGKEIVQERRGIWMLPVPNQYEDGRMCLNASFRNQGEQPIAWVDTAARALETLQVNQWFADPLFPDWKKPLSAKMFRWESKEGNAQLELPGDIKHWTKACRSVSNPTLNNYFRAFGRAYGITL